MFHFNNLTSLANLYTVRTKTGKSEYFTDLNTATGFAVSSSKSRHTAYVIWNKGKAIAAYINGKQLKDRERLYVINTPFNWDHNTSVKMQPISLAIDRSEDSVRVAKTFFNTFVMKNGKLGTKLTTSSITFHKNGRIYTYHNGKVKNSTENIQYEFDFFPEDGINILIEELRKLRPELADVITKTTLQHIPLVFANPNFYLNTDVYKGEAYVKQNTSRIINKIRSLYPRAIMNEPQVVEYVAKKLGIPCTKQLKKYYISNNGNMVLVKEAMNAGITKIDNVLKCAPRFMDLVDQKDEFTKWEMLQNKILRKLIYIKGENRFAQMLCQENPMILRDSVNMILNESVDNEIVDFIFKNASNFQEIHDTLIKYIRRTSRQLVNREIRYTEDELKLNGVFDGVNFTLAKDSKDLAIIGAAMGICVGGYAHAAIAKDTTIVKAMCNNEYVACIEIHGNRLVQLKAKFNNPVRSRYKKAIDLWLTRNNIDASRCRDYENIGGQWLSSYHYNRIDPADFEPEDNSVLRIVKAEKSEPRDSYYWLKDRSCAFIEWEAIKEGYLNDDVQTDIQMPVEAEDDELPF